LTDLSKFFEQYVKYWNQQADAFPEEIKLSSGSRDAKIDLPKLEPFKFQPLTSVALPCAPVAQVPAIPAPVVAAAPSMFTFAPLPVVPSQSLKGSFSFPLATTKPEESADVAMESPQKPAEPTKSFSFSFSQDSQQSTAAASKPIFNFALGATPAFGMMSPGASQSQAKEETGDDEPLEPATVTIIRTGAGEEGEECLAEARVKLFVFDKENGNTWTDLGVGIFKVNKWKEDSEGPNRVLCRSEASGLILINSAIIKDGTSVDWEEGKKDVKLTCLNQEGKLASYLVRNKEASTAKQITDSIKSLLQ